jgi:hypothetical protein
MDLIMKDPRITELLGDATYDDLVKAIQGIWVLDTLHIMQME